ncbi:MAG: glycosyltransferase family 4 protein [Caulobacterales bacterium]|uniref:glycosyltransferase family 4 protein n=1 Tax=Glycocaulis sp. TaxID=1969725 RepID=UPI003F9FE5F6
MHILFLTDNFPPEVNAPASRTFEHAREWVKAGAKVTVITCAPNFPKGKVFDGYRNRLRSTEELDGITVIRVWTYITANEGFYKRTLDYVSFMVSAFLASFSVRNIDVIVGTSPQFFTAMGAFLVSLLRRRPWVFELRDIWPASIKAVGAISDGPVLSVLERIEMFLYRRASHIVTVTHAFRAELAERGIDASRMSVVTNGADLSRFRPAGGSPALAASLGLEGCFVAGYVGTHGLAHGLETLLDAAALLQEQTATRHVRIVLLGDGARKAHLRQRADELGLNNIVFLDSVPKDAVPSYWGLLDVSIIHLKRDPLFTTVIPSKLFECMAMGVPVLHGVEGESADIVRREKVGETFEPENAGELAQRLTRLVAEPETLASYREAGLAAAARYDRANLAADMLGILRETAGPSRHAGSGAGPISEE